MQSMIFVELCFLFSCTSYFHILAFIVIWVVRAKTAMTFGFIARQWKPVSTLYYFELAFWSHLQKSKEVNTSFVISVCLHRTSQLPRVGVSWNLIFEYFFKICQDNSKFINTLRTGAFKLFKCAFPGSKQLQSTFILCFFKNL